MRAPQLLAIAMVCLLAVFESACARITQPIGQYQAEAVVQPEAAREAPPPDTAGKSGEGGHPAQNDAGTAAPDAGMPRPPLAGWTAWPPDVAGMSGAIATAPNVCQPMKTLPAQRKRVDLYLVVDANITLQYVGLWKFVIAGLRAFVQDPASEGIGVGLRYFGTQCDADQYDKFPTVEVGVLPDNSAALLAQINEGVDLSASPMAPALEGGIRHQTKRAQLQPDVKQAVVMMTDGIAQDLACPYSTQDLNDIAEAGFNSPAQIETYVLGFGSPDTNIPIADEVLAYFSSLDAIAEKGGTYKAITPRPGNDPGPMREALATVRRSAQPCEYVLPSDVDPGYVNFVFDANERIPRVDDRAKCGQGTGFFYEKAATISLCPATCRLLRSQDRSATLQLGCPSMKR
ncbi:MAG: hypothetical protein RL701_1501 [Pseudomonadota bacterium]|jgi:hypothetical protein